MIEVEVKETAVFAKITRQQITDYLEHKEGWEIYKELDTHTIWINDNCLYDEEVARFDVPSRDVPDWGWICKKGVAWIARADGVSVLDMLVRFGALNVQDLFSDGVWQIVDRTTAVESGFLYEMVSHHTDLLFIGVPSVDMGRVGFEFGDRFYPADFIRKVRPVSSGDAINNSDSLVRFLQELVKPTKASRQEMEELGISFINTDRVKDELGIEVEVKLENDYE